MSIRKRLLSAAVAAIAVLSAPLAAAAPPAAAAGAPILTLGGTGGTAVANGDTLTASGTATFATTSGGSTKITCNATVTIRMSGNPGSDGNADFTITFTFSGCTSNLTGFTKINSVAFSNQPYNGRVTPAGVVAVTGSITLTVSAGTVLGNVTCTHTAADNAGVGGPSLVAAFHNVSPPNSIAIPPNQLNLTTGSGICPKTLFFSAAFGPLTDTTQGGQKVFDNPGQD